MNLDAAMRDYALLVTSCSKPYVRRHPEWREDIEQEGMLGLILAARRFDPSRGLKFSTFAHWYIVGLIKHFVRDFVPVVRGPRGGLAPKVYSFEDTAVRADGHMRLHDVLGRADPGIAACEDRADIGRAAAALSPRLRGAAFAIATGHRYVDVARREGIGRRAFFKRIRRAKEALRKTCILDGVAETVR
jgi:RNA polymerase sigma-B factor